MHTFSFHCNEEQVRYFMHSNSERKKLPLHDWNCCLRGFSKMAAEWWDLPERDFGAADSGCILNKCPRDQQFQGRGTIQWLCRHKHNGSLNSCFNVNRQFGESHSFSTSCGQAQSNPFITDLGPKWPVWIEAVPKSGWY